MTHEEFEDLVSPRIRNFPIVRELDRVRQRELRGLLILAVALVAVVFVSLWQHFEMLQHGYRLEQMRQEHARQRELNRHLRLDVEALRSPARIERVAVGQLHMVAPAGPEEVVLEHAPEAPARELPVLALRQGVSSEPIPTSN